MMGRYISIFAYNFAMFVAYFCQDEGRVGQQAEVASALQHRPLLTVPTGQPLGMSHERYDI